MEVTISSCSGDAARAAETLLGHNLEMASDTPFGIQSDRIRNATLSGFADQQTGIAPEWLPYPNHNFSGIRYELTPGMYLSGKSAQLIHNFCHRNDKGKGIVQKGIHLIGGERVVVTLWARAQHEPVSMSIGLRPMAKGHPYYDSASITIAATYWKEYTVTLSTPLTDDNALLTCTLDGSGMVWIDQIHLAAEGAGVVSPEMEKKIASLHVPVLRFPGGCISTTYHWRLGTGPQYLRPIELDPVFKMSVSYIFGTDEYLEFCTRNGITPQITINIGTGTVQEAEDWASYCAAWFKQRNLDLPLMYWQIGNEHYGSWELGNMSPEMYVAALHEFVPAVKRGYPNSRIIGLGPASGETLNDNTAQPWRSVVLQGAGNLLDLIALQIYHGAYNENEEIQHAVILKATQLFTDSIRQAIDDCRQFSPQTRVAVTEWNLWCQATHHDGTGFHEPYDVQHGLYVATMLQQFARLAPELELVNFYHLVNPMGVFRSYGGAIEESSLADIFRLYRPAFPGKVQPLTVSSQGQLDGIPAVNALRIDTTDGAFLFVTNWHISEDAHVILHDLPPVTEGVVLAGSALHEGFTTTTESPDGQVIRIPPMSVSRWRLA